MRRYDLDWLRVIVFALLIIYHTGMFFVPWGWHIKNNIIYDWLRWPMIFVSQWRLPILFVISGMGTWYALAKRTGSAFAGERARRLLIPLVFGMLVVVPPQVYFERLWRGQFTGGYFDFYPAHAFSGVYPEGNLSWHHLWFLPYLLVFSLMLIPAFLYLRRHSNAFLNRLIRKQATSPIGLFIVIIPLYLWESFLEPFFPSTHALVGDWFNLVNYLTFFFIGYLLISSGDTFWKTVMTYRRRYLVAAIIAFILYISLILSMQDSFFRHFTEALLKVVNLWAWILTFFGYASMYLNKPGKALKWAGEAVYPFYILHQTVTVAIGYYINNLDMGFWPKFFLLLAGTIIITFIIYEYGIRPWRWIRPLFGMKHIDGRRKTEDGRRKIRRGEGAMGRRSEEAKGRRSDF